MHVFCHIFFGSQAASKDHRTAGTMPEKADNLHHHPKQNYTLALKYLQNFNFSNLFNYLLKFIFCYPSSQMINNSYGSLT